MQTYQLSARYRGEAMATLRLVAPSYQEAVQRMVAYLKMEFVLPEGTPVTISCQF